MKMLVWILVFIAVLLAFVMVYFKLRSQKKKQSELLNYMKEWLPLLRAYEKDWDHHTRQIRNIGRRLGERLGLSEEDLRKLELLLILHDLGIIEIPKEIVHKETSLTDEEWRILQSHSVKGYQLVQTKEELQEIAELILYHHERWDGRGYPSGISKESIPLLSRIVSIVVSYEAMRSDRMYRPKMSRKSAMDELRKNAGTQFDPLITAQFLEMMDEEFPEVESVASEDEIFDMERNVPSWESRRQIDFDTLQLQRRVFEIPCGRCSVDRELHIRKMDSGFFEISGYSLNSEEQNSLKLDLMVPLEDRDEYRIVLGYGMDHSHAEPFEHRIICKNNSEKFVVCIVRYGAESSDEKLWELLFIESSQTHSFQLMCDEFRHQSINRLNRWESKYRCDSLTGLLNREALKNDTQSWLLKRDYTILMIMLDLDYFKQYNDSRGHHAGDQLLVYVAKLLKDTLRERDLSGRMGGDEFAAVLLFDIDISKDVIYRRVQQIINKINQLLIDEETGTTISAGAALADESILNFNQLYEAADKALYASKENGRSRLSFFDSL